MHFAVWSGESLNAPSDQPELNDGESGRDQAWGS